MSIIGSHKHIRHSSRAPSDAPVMDDRNDSFYSTYPEFTIPQREISVLPFDTSTVSSSPPSNDCFHIPNASTPMNVVPPMPRWGSSDSLAENSSRNSITCPQAPAFQGSGSIYSDGHELDSRLTSLKNEQTVIKEGRLWQENSPDHFTQVWAVACASTATVPGILTLFRDEEQMFPLQVIYLSDFKSVNCRRNTKGSQKRWRFYLQENEQDIVFACGDKEGREDWIMKIQGLLLNRSDVAHNGEGDGQEIIPSNRLIDSRTGEAHVQSEVNEQRNAGNEIQNLEVKARKKHLLLDKDDKQKREVDESDRLNKFVEQLEKSTQHRWEEIQKVISQSQPATVTDVACFIQTLVDRANDQKICLSEFRTEVQQSMKNEILPMLTKMETSQNSSGLTSEIQNSILNIEAMLEKVNSATTIGLRALREGQCQEVETVQDIKKAVQQGVEKLSQQYEDMLPILKMHRTTLETAITNIKQPDGRNMEQHNTADRHLMGDAPNRSSSPNDLLDDYIPRGRDIRTPSPIPMNGSSSSPCAKIDRLQRHIDQISSTQHRFLAACSERMHVKPNIDDNRMAAVQDFMEGLDEKVTAGSGNTQDLLTRLHDLVASTGHKIEQKLEDSEERSRIAARDGRFMVEKRIEQIARSSEDMGKNLSSLPDNLAKLLTEVVSKHNSSMIHEFTQLREDVATVCTKNAESSEGVDHAVKHVGSQLEEMAQEFQAAYSKTMQLRQSKLQRSTEDISELSEYVRDKMTSNEVVLKEILNCLECLADRQTKSDQESSCSPIVDEMKTLLAGFASIKTEGSPAPPASPAVQLPNFEKWFGDHRSATERTTNQLDSVSSSIRKIHDTLTDFKDRVLVNIRADKGGQMCVQAKLFDLQRVCEKLTHTQQKLVDSLAIVQTSPSQNKAGDCDAEVNSQEFVDLHKQVAELKALLTDKPIKPKEAEGETLRQHMEEIVQASTSIVLEDMSQRQDLLLKQVEQIITATTEGDSNSELKRIRKERDELRDEISSLRDRVRKAEGELELFKSESRRLDTSRTERIGWKVEHRLNDVRDLEVKQPPID